MSSNEFIKNIKKNISNENINININILNTEICKDLTTSSIFPIYYFFDKFIDEEIGCTSEYRTKVRELLHLDTLFKLDSTNIIDVRNPGHSTLLYKIEIQQNFYIYYSNSGLGINNNIIINGNIVPKIFKVKNEELYNFIPNYINGIIFCFIGQLVPESIHMNVDLNVDLNVDNIYQYINMLCSSFEKLSIKKIELKEIYIKILRSSSRDKDLINLCYALLYYVSSTMNDLFYECSYLDLISPNDNKNNSYDQYLNVNLFTLFTNCDKNKNNSNISHNISKNISNNHNITKFKELITKINERIDIICETTPTLKFKKKHLKFNFEPNFGIVNYQQKAGSCVFYSYYNLAINMLLLDIFINHTNIDKYIHSIIKFHYYMIFLFCKTNIISEFPNIFFNNCFIYNLFNNNNLSSEIIDFFKLFKISTIMLN